MSAGGELAGRRALVTGATGFIGGRLAERLVSEGARVRVLLRGAASAARVARLPVEFAPGDVTDPGSLQAAAAGCDLVFHCAYGTTGSQRHRAWVNREGTRQVLAAAARAGARRVVHLSTLMVYGRTADGELDETAPRRRFGNAYSDSKLAAERLALREARAGRVPVVVLQPTAVYGPFGGVWTAQVLATLRAGRVILVDGGLGLCNAVYVDDLVDAMLAAATGDGVVGEAFLVSDGEPVPWRDFYGCFERMLGERRTVAMSADEARAHYRRARRRVPALLPELLATVRRDEGARDRLLATRELLALRELASAVLPEALQQRIKSRLLRGGATPGAGPGDAARAAAGEDPIHPLTPQMIGFYRTRTRVRIDKARRVLGWSPAHTLAAGMAKTEAWARWADLLGR